MSSLTRNYSFEVRPDQEEFVVKDEKCNKCQEINNADDSEEYRHDHHHGDSSKQTSTPFVWCLSCFAAIGGFLFGYDTGVVSGAMLLIRDRFSLSSVWQELVVSVTIGTAFVAALMGGSLNDLFGRRVVILLASSIFTAGAVVLGLAQNVAMLVAGRAVLGLGIGFASMSVPVYIAESAPLHLRGRLVTVNTMFITGGQCIASFVDAGFSYLKTDGWRYMLGLAGIPAVIQLVGFLFLPESPRWLMRKGRKNEALVVLQRIRGTTNVFQELNEIQASLDEEDKVPKSDGMTILRILRTPTVRKAVMVGCGLQLFQQLSGINTVMYYSASIISMSGVSDQHEAIFLAAAMATVNFLFTLVGVWLVERIGRKPLIMASLLGSGLSLVLSAVSFQLAALHSPAITQHGPPDHNHSQCSSYRWCEPCIENTDCGFCYRTTNGSVVGACQATDPDHSSHSFHGLCENSSSLPSDVIWAYDYCPTPYWWISILAMLLYLVFFAPGMGPMPWTINSELYPLWARSTGNSLSSATNWLANLAVSMSFLTLTDTLTKYGTYWLFFGFTMVGLLFFAVYLPETKNKKLEEVEELFREPWCSCSCSRNKQRSVPLANHIQGYSTLGKDEGS